MKNHPQAHVFFFSSAAVYGNPQTLPITENTPVLPISPYGIHKSTAETLLENYSRALGLCVTVFRIFSVYGVGLRKQLVYDVSQRARQAAALGQESIMLFGTGLETRDFIYVKDVCKAVLLVLSQPVKAPFTTYNLASGVESTVAEVAQCIIKHLNIKVNINFNGVVPKGDPTNWRADIDKVLQLGFKSDYNLDDGLMEVAHWAKVHA
ncbi:NAD-dependent epimerase/dehydratase family protein [Mucilaginibacter sp. SP1R1]|uniref:NAD-dependent epimerase/dehydratase family protein n=1 Tax=Mucilaginibacter sp. SP1R1 TaxID=2723091 RepID=UPI00161FDC01|nr:nucleoside-diphosphate-sugar epimerase [Mucilaginibacter sp. SP1R1]